MSKVVVRAIAPMIVEIVQRSHGRIMIETTFNVMTVNGALYSARAESRDTAKAIKEWTYSHEVGACCCFFALDLWNLIISSKTNPFGFCFALFSRSPARSGSLGPGLRLRLASGTYIRVKHRHLHEEV